MQITRHVQTIAAVIMSTCLASSAMAMEKEEALAAMDKVYDATINSYYSVNSFYNFSANQADKEQQQVVQFTVGTVEDLMIDISGMLSDTTLTSQVDAARDAWITYEDSLNQNIEIVKDTGYTDLRLVGELAEYNISFNDTLSVLYNSVASDSGINSSKGQNLVHDAGKLAALIMTKYSARSTSTVSQVYARDDDNDITLDALAAEFESTLSKLMSTTTNPEALKMLDSARTKWEFIAPSVINYNENRVNFIVNLYTKKIIEDLAGASQI